MGNKKTWEDAYHLASEVGKGTRPTKTRWGYRCPECNKIVVPQLRWIEGTHNMLEYYGCRHCEWEFAFFRQARQLYAEYASPIYKPEEEIRIRPWWIP